MARLARLRTVLSDDDDEFPEIDVLVGKKRAQAANTASTSQPRPRDHARETEKPSSTVRRRKLGPLTDNLLLRAWTPDSAEDGQENGFSLEHETEERPRRTRAELRSRSTRSGASIPSLPVDEDEEYVSAQEEITIAEEISIFDDTFHSCDSDDSDFRIYEDEDDADEEEDDGFGTPPRAARSPAKSRIPAKDRQSSNRSDDGEKSKDTRVRRQGSERSQRESCGEPAERQRTSLKLPSDRMEVNKAGTRGKDLADTMSRLQISEDEEQPPRRETSRSGDRDVTPPSTPPKARPGLVSPRKLPRIPITPHRPSSDMFWSQEFVDDWNDEHSPRKQLFPDATAARQKNPTKANTEKPKKAPSKKQSEREAKKAFEQTKHELAEKFLEELDATITDGKIGELAASTGGVKVVWTNKLNTTAGRANWKRETIRVRKPDGSSNGNDNNGPAAAAATKHRHHASIELAEKVIDDEHRLLNVLAHEFCHLANFMISGVTTNPHGREFKAWAARATAAFGGRGVQVTTKHSYDIDFKYVWECVACAAEFKRHSRSIDPARHRCGTCRSELRQTKPVPRKAGGGKGDAAGPAKVSEYQAFMKEHMRVVRAENPGSPQKEIMKIVAGRWAAHKDRAKAAAVTVEVREVEGPDGPAV